MTLAVLVLHHRCASVRRAQVVAAFQSVQLVASDYMASLPPALLPVCLETVSLYAQQQVGNSSPSHPPCGWICTWEPGSGRRPVLVVASTGLAPSVSQMRHGQPGVVWLVARRRRECGVCLRLRVRPAAGLQLVCSALWPMAELPCSAAR